MKLVFATNNQHKLHELRTMLGSKFELLSLSDIGCTDEIPEEQPTLEGNARQKAQFIFNKYKINCFADDTGLEIESLNGEPGVYSARYAGPDNNAQANMDKVLSNLAKIKNRNARFRTVILLILDGKEYAFEGIVDGTILSEKKGTTGFGYDPIFLPNGFNQTFAEMALSEKNTISHRGRAVKKLTDFLTMPK